MTKNTEDKTTRTEQPVWISTLSCRVCGEKLELSVTRSENLAKKEVNDPSGRETPIHECEDGSFGVYVWDGMVKELRR